MGILGTKRAKAVAGGVGGVVIAGGTALAAILLTTTITGQAKINEVDTSNQVSVSVDATNGTQLNCSDIKVSSDYKSLTFNPVLTKVKAGPNATGQPIPGGDCTITLSVKNTGNTTLKLDGSSKLSAPPTGWTVTPLAGTALSPIKPGDTATVTAKLAATDKAEAGNISGQLVYSDAS